MTGGKNRMKVLVTGVNGQLGHDMVNELVRRGHQAVGSDITDRYAGAADGTGRAAQSAAAAFFSSFMDDSLL